MTIRTLKTGHCRSQASFLPARIEDYVSRDNPVHAIEAYVCALDLAALGSTMLAAAAAVRVSRRMIRPIC